MTHVPTQRSPRRTTPTPRWLWIVLASVFIAGLLVTTAITEKPGANIGPNAEALASVSLQGMATRITSATYQVNGRAFSLQWQHGGLWPRHTLQPDTIGVVRISVAGPTWLDWLPFNHGTVSKTIETPANPSLANPLVNIGVDQAVSVALKSPAADMRIVKPEEVALVTPPSPVTQFRLTTIATPPNKEGQVVVETAARSWETLSKPQVLHWKTANWLTASIHTEPVSTAKTISVTFSSPISRTDLAKWQFLPSVPGQWTQVSPTTWKFESSGSGWGPGAQVALKIPGGQYGVRATNGSYLATTVTQEFNVAPGSVLRLDQLLAELGYLPLTWTPTGTRLDTLGGQQAAVYSPPAGTFTWRYSDTPATLEALWQPNVYNVMVKGAVMQFERVNGLVVDGIAGPEVWQALIAARLADHVNPDGYSYVHVSETLPETLQLWYNGKVVLTSLCNTGIPQSPTYLGTYPVYIRYLSQTMSGVNPFGQPYSDPGVPYVNYFNGGDAVHGFPRAQYGFPQSLGCVELPIANAAIAWNYIHYGTLVGVFPPA